MLKMRIYGSINGNHLSKITQIVKAEMDPKPQPPFSLIMLLTSVPSWQWNTCKWQIILPLVRKRGKQRITFLVHFFFFFFCLIYSNIFLCSVKGFPSWMMNTRNLSLADIQQDIVGIYLSRISLPVSYSNLLKIVRKEMYFSLIKR